MYSGLDMCCVMLVRKDDFKRDKKIKNNNTLQRARMRPSVVLW